MLTVWLPLLTESEEMLDAAALPPLPLNLSYRTVHLRFHVAARRFGRCFETSYDGINSRRIFEESENEDVVKWGHLVLEKISE